MEPGLRNSCLTQTPDNLTSEPPSELSFSSVCFQIVEHQTEIEVLLVSYARAAEQLIQFKRTLHLESD